MFGLNSEGKIAFFSRNYDKEEGISNEIANL